MKENDQTECNCWGYKFHWTKRHIPQKQLDRLLFSYDSLADECLQVLNEISNTNQAVQDKDKESSKKDLYSLQRDFADSNPKLARLWSEVNTIPEWVDWDQISRGQDVFYRYGLPILSAVRLILTDEL